MPVIKNIHDLTSIYFISIGLQNILIIAYITGGVNLSGSGAGYIRTNSQTISTNMLRKNDKNKQYLKLALTA